MTAIDEAIVMYPAMTMKADLYYERYMLAEKIILALRRHLREQDPSLPHELSGQEWWLLEESWGA